MKVPRTIALTVVACLLLAAVLGQANSQANATTSPAASVNATIDSFAFAPKELTVKAGSTVAWTNKDDTPHTVTSDNGAFGSPVMDTDQSFQFTFQEPGRFPYHCRLHPTMTGVVVVQ